MDKISSDGAPSIKKEKLDGDIKDFAENAMNELLGWYGYENSDEHKRVGKIYRSNSDCNSSESEFPKLPDECVWCGKSVKESLGLKSTIASFCSEMCFSQSRRANFKKTKTCDWCRNVKNTICYVDFQDGAQLQFCSEKCLNQYKMHIFCRETSAHLEQHPHLYEDDATSGMLITPDLWMKNCKSPVPRPITSPPEPQTAPLSLIAVAPPTKLMGRRTKRVRDNKVMRTRKQYSSTVTNSSDVCEAPQDLRVRHDTPADVEAETKIPALQDSDETLPKPTETSLRQSFEGLLPPATILLPYPIFLPVPIPIPIPLPILRQSVKNVDASSQTDFTEYSTSQNEVPEVNKTCRSLRIRKEKVLKKKLILRK
ncbi:unnamed protein product [Brassicogethes aeneus]|uniref:TRASH domain-containing protein n=1 Tax=Brassicogethes aeneus TaxID=1431903 RepID=A0A9P0B2J0_BRAAE|nr:unnamed protein product [Brassicogethes aeneus]